MKKCTEEQAPFGARKGGSPKGGGNEISRFFFSSPATISLFLCLWVSSRGILVVFLKRRDPQMCTFGVLGLSCEAPAALKPRAQKLWTKKREILGGPTEEGGPAEGGPGKSKPTTPTTTKPQ